jgi:dephospho-CoA kinase
MLCSAAMVLVGLTGGIATGKTTVANMLKRCGAVVMDADALARKVVQPGKPAWRAIVQTFGRNVLNPDQTINRHALGRIVFRSRTKRRLLEKIIHPRVARLQAQLTRQATRRTPDAVIIYDVPLLFEAGIHNRFDKIIVITADSKNQIARLKTRNGLTRAVALQRIRSQMPLSKKVHKANYVLDGTLSKSALRRQVRQLYRTLRTFA